MILRATVVVVALGLAGVVYATQGPPPDADWALSIDTVERMRSGQGFYWAYRDAAGMPMERPRSVRQPAYFLLRAQLPQGTEEAVGVAAMIGTLVLIAGIARREFGDRGAIAAVAVYGAYTMTYADATSTHAEHAAVLLAVIGVQRALADRPAQAAWWVAAATLVREHFAVMLAIGVVVFWRRARLQWLTASLIAAWALVAHGLAARGILVPAGYGAEAGYTETFLLPAWYGLGLAGTRIVWALGFVLLAAGLVGAARRRGDPVFAWMTLCCFVLAAATAYGGRYYWTPMWVPFVALGIGTSIGGRHGIRDRVGRRRRRAGVAGGIGFIQRHRSRARQAPAARLLPPRRGAALDQS